MTKPRVKIKHPKLRGEWAEMRFMAKAAENGLQVAKPYGEMARYDFAVEHEGQFARVQVKSTISMHGRGYACTMRGWRSPYGRNAFDYVAVYLILEDLWYIIPAKNIRARWTLGLYPNLKNARYEPYREAWYLLRGESARSGRVRSIEACAEEWTISPFSVPGPHDESPHIPLAGI
jgi:HEPN domain-containing protein